MRTDWFFEIMEEIVRKIILLIWKIWQKIFYK